MGAGRRYVRVVAGIYLRSGKILMGCRHKNEGGRFVGYWEFPGGGVETGESEEEALRREFLEELNANIEAMKFYRRLEWSYPDKDIELSYYFVQLPDSKIKSFALNAHSCLEWFDLDRALTVQVLPANRKIIEDLKSGESFEPFKSSS